VTLREELDLTALWTDVMRARFGDRLDVVVEASPEVDLALVPPLVLQPLLENALKHGNPGPGRVAHVGVRASRVPANGRGERLILEVRDNGPGLSILPAEALASGFGLSTTRRRLEAMYDRDARIELHNPEGGGLQVTLAIPFRVDADG
jgi:LytS/YehU family sensor histidine kinase